MLRKELLRRRQEALQHLEPRPQAAPEERRALPESFQWLRRLAPQERGAVGRCSSPRAAWRALKGEAPRGVLEAPAVVGSKQ